MTPPIGWFGSGAPEWSGTSREQSVTVCTVERNGRYGPVTDGWRILNVVTLRRSVTIT